MTDNLLKSYEFRKERETSWQELETIVRKAEKGGIKKLSAEEAIRLPNLYRTALSSLSVARNISLDKNLLGYLENLTTRAFFQVYGAHSSFSGKLAEFFLHGFPNAVRTNIGCMLLATAFMVVGAIVGFILTTMSPEWYYSLMPEQLIQGRSPQSSQAELLDGLFPSRVDSNEALTTFASFLFSNNAGVGMLAFALGFALGIPTAILMFQTGLMLGTFMALYHSKGILFELGGWLLIHGVTELGAIILCGGAGFMLASVFLTRQRQSKISYFAERGKLAGRIVIGAVVMLFVAAILEGYFRQLITDTTIRYGIAACSLALWLTYFSRSGDKS